MGQATEHPARDGAPVVPLRGARPVESWPVGPAVVLLMTGLLLPGGIVDLAELVTAPHDRHAAPARCDGVRQEDAPEGGIGLRRRAGVAQTGEGGRRTADPTVSGHGVLLEHESVRPRA